MGGKNRVGWLEEGKDGVYMAPKLSLRGRAPRTGLDSVFEIQFVGGGGLCVLQFNHQRRAATYTTPEAQQWGAAPQRAQGKTPYSVRQLSVTGSAALPDSLDEVWTALVSPQSRG